MAGAAMQFKLEGNRLFSLKKYDEAIKQYTKAISKSASNSVFYINRALCNLKLQRWNDVVSDCKTGLENDAQSIKGHFFLGQAYVELEMFDEAIINLSRANDLAQQQKQNFGDEVASMLRIAKRGRWQKMEKERIKQEIELQTYINNLITKERDQELQQLDENKSDGNSSDSTNPDVSRITEKYQSKMDDLNNIFAQVDERRKTREVPDYLCGKISFEIMKDPVITPSGITYDRKDIEEHLQRVGHFDPVTRHELKLNQLIPNLAMRDVISNYIEENGWVEDY